MKRSYSKDLKKTGEDLYLAAVFAIEKELKSYNKSYTATEINEKIELYTNRTQKQRNEQKNGRTRSKYPLNWLVPLLIIINATQAEARICLIYGGYNLLNLHTAKIKSVLAIFGALEDEKNLTIDEKFEIANELLREEGVAEHVIDL